MIDAYRTTLFKKNLRAAIGAPWLRFYYSKGKCNLCIQGHDIRSNENTVIERLTRSRIDFTVSRDVFGLETHKPEAERQLWSINIPIDQEALPERKLKYAEREGEEK